MISLGELFRRAWYVIHRERATAELEEEMRLHRELRAERMREQGVDRTDADAASRRRFGNAVAFAERSRDAWGLAWLEHAAGDARFALRRLRRRPAFALSTIAVTALGVGATTAVFSAVDAALLRPLPFARPWELVTLSARVPSMQRTPPSPGSPHMVDMIDVAPMTDMFASVAAFAAGGLNLTDGVRPQRVKAGVVTVDFFSTLGALPQVGRTFDAGEGKPDGPRAVILSDALWRGRFGASDVIGRTIELSGDRYTVVGVMKPGFNFPNESDLWIPLSVPTSARTFGPFRGFLPSRVIARLAPGVTPEVASRRMIALWEQSVVPLGNGRRSNLEDMLREVRARGGAIPLQRQLVGNQRTALLVLMGATLLLLLIACSNVANLLLSDATTRGREVALRGVLGASASRIIRQLLVESSTLALVGTAAGVALAPTALTILRATMPPNLAGVAPAQLDMRVLSFAVALALTTGLLFGLWPALSTVRSSAAETIKAGGGGGATAGKIGYARRILITAELALTVMLLVGAGLMLRSLDRLLSQRLGLDPSHVGTVEMAFAPLPASTRASRLATLHGTLDRLATDPAIQSAAVVNDIPLGTQATIMLNVTADGMPRPKGDPQFVRWLYASGGYFRTLGISLERGRTFTAADDSSAAATAVINRAMAKRWWPDADPLGRTFRIGGDSSRYTVIGIVSDVREQTFGDDPLPQMYLSIDRETPQNVAVVARSSLPPAALLSRITAAVHNADPSQAVYNLRMMESVLSKSVAPQRTNTTLITAFGAIALVLSVFGIYAVISYSVSQRAREFGIRAALGATGRNIAALVSREIVWTVGLGVSIGLVGAWMLVRLISSLLYGVDVHDATTFVSVPLLLTIPAAVATLIPARRAIRVNPTEVMRAE